MAALSERRAALVQGAARPSAEELEGLGVADAEAAAAASAASSTSAAGSSHHHHHHQAKGVPYFWASVLRNCDAVGARVTRRDALALEWLRDVRRVSGGADGTRGVELVFDAAKNPYFSNRVLRRVIGPGVDEGSGIDWKPGMDLTVRRVEKRAKGGKNKKNKGGGGGKKNKKNKHGGGGGGESDGDDDEAPARTQVRLKPCPSFFRFFEASGALRGGHGHGGGGGGGGGGSARDAHLDRLLAPGGGGSEIRPGGGSDGSDGEGSGDDEADERVRAEGRGERLVTGQAPSVFCFPRT